MDTIVVNRKFKKKRKDLIKANQYNICVGFMLGIHVFDSQKNTFYYIKTGTKK